jgi:hypothetical protein
MALRTQESLQKLFEASRLRNEKRKQEEQLKYKKAQESTKKTLAKQQSKKQEKTPQKGWKHPQITFRVYNIKYVERFADEDDLYTSREELEEAMPHNINWTLWDSLVNKTRKELEK